MAPLAVGDHARGLFDHPPLTALADAARFKLADLRQIGGDLRLTLQPREAHISDRSEKQARFFFFAFLRARRGRKA